MTMVMEIKNQNNKRRKIIPFSTRAVHQEIALSNCTIIEASTPHFNDRVRVEKKIWYEGNKGIEIYTKKRSYSKINLMNSINVAFIPARKGLRD